MERTTERTGRTLVEPDLQVEPGGLSTPSSFGSEAVSVAEQSAPPTNSQRTRRPSSSSFPTLHFPFFSFQHVSHLTKVVHNKAGDLHSEVRFIRLNRNSDLSTGSLHLPPITDSLSLPPPRHFLPMFHACRLCNAGCSAARTAARAAHAPRGRDSVRRRARCHQCVRR